MFLIALVLLAALVPAASAASPADSAAVARNEWRAAREARFRNENVAAMLHAERAHSAWPMQWYYAYGLATLAAAAGEPTTAARALDDLAAIGAGVDLAQDSTLYALAKANTTVATSALRVRANLEPLAASTVRATFPAADSAFWPEGLASDGKRFFLAGIRQHKVAALGKDGVPRDFASTGAWAALAVAVDAKRKRVWVTSAALPQGGTVAPGDTGRAAVEAFALSDGRSLARHELPPAPEGHVPGDVCVAPNGDVYVSDSAHPAIYRIALGDSLREWVADPAFRSLQGQAVAADGRTLYVADYSHGIAAIDIATRAVHWLDAPAGASILGLDGMALAGNTLVAVQNGLAPPRIVRLTLAPGAITALQVLDRNLPLADEPTMGVVEKGAFVYVANSQWEKYDDGGTRKPGTVLGSPRLLTVPLR
jgi:sugar lactone lactonase YvrE